jgi:hypothetical protein
MESSDKSYIHWDSYTNNSRRATFIDVGVLGAKEEDQSFNRSTSKMVTMRQWEITESNTKLETIVENTNSRNNIRP